jgi:hypothetical protein
LIGPFELNPWQGFVNFDPYSVQVFHHFLGDESS